MPGWLRKIFGASSSPRVAPDANPQHGTADLIPQRVAGDTSPRGVYTALRNAALSTRRAKISVPEPTADAPVWGMLMETGYASATATLFALADGTTSLYLSTGGGVIGGQGHASVRDANAAFLKAANVSRAHLTPATSFPIPAVGETTFYALTDSGVLTGGAPEADLGHGRHSLSPLFLAGHGVLTHLRLISTRDGQQR